MPSNVAFSCRRACLPVFAHCTLTDLSLKGQKCKRGRSATTPGYVVFVISSISLYDFDAGSFNVEIASVIVIGSHDRALVV